jgi:hypothetical protein
MDRGPERGKIALGVGLAIGMVLSVAFIGGMRESVIVLAVESVRTQLVNEPAVESDSISSESSVSELSVDEVIVDPLAELPEALLPQTDQCRLSGVPLGYGSFGDDIFCLQSTLANMMLFEGDQNGLYDDNTFAAVLNYQLVRGLQRDGIVGRKTGLMLGIWPLDPFTVERTPVPAPGAVDLWGMPLSSVATAGPDAPALPANSGAGHRLVYDRAAQRIWAIDEREVVIRSWLISGSTQDNEIPGIHKVYSRSKKSISKDGDSGFSYMVRWLKTRDDAIGFHSLPWRTFDDSPYQTEDELGIRLSSGCQRQADLDAQFTWRFAPVGTIVVVL